MGYLPSQETQEKAGLGPLQVEVRRESFVLMSSHPTLRPYVYPDRSGSNTGSVEFLIADIPHLLAALSLVERVASGEEGL